MADFSQDDFAQTTKCSPAMLQDYADWGVLLERWNAKINLVAPSTLSDYWHRHAYDSWQVTPLIKNIDGAPQCLDLGSGAGFPGLALAIALKHKGEGHVTLVESAGKKANFLRTVIRELSLPARVLNERVETLDLPAFDVISARAFAPLDRLFAYAHPFWKKDTIGLFLKGRGLASEASVAQNKWEFELSSQVSLTDPDGFIAEIKHLAPCDVESRNEE